MTSVTQHSPSASDRAGQSASRNPLFIDHISLFAVSAMLAGSAGWRGMGVEAGSGEDQGMSRTGKATRWGIAVLVLIVGGSQAAPAQARYSVTDEDAMGPGSPRVVVLHDNVAGAGAAVAPSEGGELQASRSRAMAGRLNCSITRATTRRRPAHFMVGGRCCGRRWVRSIRWGRFPKKAAAWAPLGWPGRAFQCRARGSPRICPGRRLRAAPMRTGRA